MILREILVSGGVRRVLAMLLVIAMLLPNFAFFASAEGTDNDISSYSKDLRIYNYLHRSNSDNSDTIPSSNGVFALSGDFQHKMIIGGDAKATDEIMKPMAQDIELQLEGLTVSGTVTVQPVYPDAPSAYKTVIRVTQASKIAALTLVENAVLEITLEAELEITELTLAEGSSLTIHGASNSLTLTNTSGAGTLTIDGGIITGASLSAGNLHINGATVTMDAAICAVYALEMNAVTVSAKTITAGTAITADNSAINNAELFGASAEATGTVSIGFTACSFHNVVRVGAADECAALVRFADGCSVSAEAQSYVRDYTITYEGVTPGDDWMASYRVSSASLAGEGIILGDKDLPEYNQEGYIFKGWKTAADAETAIENLAGQTGDLTLYPSMEAKDVDLTIDLMFKPGADNCDDYASILEKYNKQSESSNYLQRSVKLGATVTLDKPLRFGYQFQGWKRKDQESVITESEYVITLDGLTNQEPYELALEAVWTEDTFPLYWSLVGTVPVEKIEMSVDGKTWYMPAQFAEVYSQFWTLEGNLLKTTTAGQIAYGESLDEYFQRLGGENGWTCLQLRDTRTDGSSKAFRTWGTVHGLSVAGQSTFSMAETGFLAGFKTSVMTWLFFQETFLKNTVITLMPSFGTADYVLTIPADTGWDYAVNGAEAAVVDGVILVPNGATVTLSSKLADKLSISNWEFTAQNGIPVTVTERYDNKDVVYYDFTMPASDVVATYTTSNQEKYINIADGAITFVEDEDAAGTGLTWDGFWQKADKPLDSGTSTYKGLPLLGMTPLTYDAQKGYFYIWDFSKTLYITSDGVDTTNQLTLVKGMTVYFNAANLSVRKEFLDNAVGRTIYGYSVEKPRDSGAAGSMAALSDDIREKGGLAPLGNIVLANDASSPQTFTLNFIGQENTVGSVFSDQYYYSANNTLIIQGSGNAPKLTLGTVFANCKMTVSNISVTAEEQASSIYLLHANYGSANMSISNATIHAPEKEIYTKDALLTVGKNADVDVGEIVAGQKLTLGENAKLRVRKNVYVGYQSISLGKNSTTVIDGNLLIKYNHWSTVITSNNSAGAVLIVKGNRCELGNFRWNAGTLICNVMVLGRTGGVDGGIVVANQIINPPLLNWNIALNATEYTYTSDSQLESANKNGDNVPFLTYSQKSSTSDVYRFSGNARVYLLGCYDSTVTTYDQTRTVSATPVQTILEKLLDAAGNYNGQTVDEDAAKAEVEKQEYAGNECIVLGNSTYITDTRERTIEFSGNVQVYAAGNLTLFNETTVKDNARIWCGGTFGSKNDVTVTGGEITAKEVGIAYDLTTVLEDNTIRWKKLTISGGNVNAQQIGVLSTCVSNSQKVNRGVISIAPACVSDCTIVSDEYVNYMMGTAGFTNPDTNTNSVRIVGEVTNGTPAYRLEKTVTFGAPQYGDSQTGQWRFGTVSGTKVSGVNESAMMVVEEAGESIAAYAEERIALYPVKEEYAVKVQLGLNYVTDLHCQGQTETTEAKAGDQVTITVSTEEHARKTVVWYVDANGFVRNPGYSVSGNTITFTMPYNDVEVFVAPEGMELDLSKYHVTITKDGFWTTLDGTEDDRAFSYAGNIRIKQSETAKTPYRIQVLADVDNITEGGRTFTLNAINQQKTLGDIGLLLEDGAKAHFMIDGKVQLYRVEVRENSEIVLEGLERDYTKHQLFVKGDDENTTALGYNYGKTGNITIKNLKILSNSDNQFEIFASGTKKNAESTVSYIGCQLTVTDWYSSSYLAKNVGKVLIDSCTFNLTCTTTWPSPLFAGCDEVEIKSSSLTYEKIGTSSGNTQSWTYGVKNRITVTDSTVTVTLRNSTTTNYRVEPYSSSNAPVLELAGSTVYNAEQRSRFKTIILNDNSVLNAGGDTKDGYLFATNIQVQNNAELNAGTVLVAGYLTETVNTKEQVLEALGKENPTVQDGNAGGLFISGGTVNAKEVGGDKNAKIQVTGGVLNADRIGTMGALYGYGLYTPKTSEQWVYTYSKVPTGASVTISGGVVNVGAYLGGMNASVDISGGKVNLNDGAVLGMTDAQAETLKTHFITNGDDINSEAHAYKNVDVRVSGGVVAGESGTINVPYGTLEISGQQTGVKVQNILANYGQVTIKETKGIYDNGIANQEKVGVSVSGFLKGQQILIEEGAYVYAGSAIAFAPLEDDEATLSVTGEARLFTRTFGTDGKGNATASGESDENIVREERRYSITYYLHDDATDPAKNDNPDSFVYSETPVTLSEPTRHGYNFKGWYTTEDCTGEPLKQFYPDTKDMAFYAKWEPQTVTFQIVIYRADHSGIDLKAEGAGIAGYDSELGVLTFTKQVSVPYREKIFGTGENQINLTDYNLLSYSCTTIRYDEDGLKDVLDPISDVITADLLARYQKKGEPIVLRITKLSNMNKLLTLDLNLQNGRPAGAGFAGNHSGVTLSGRAPIGGTISQAEALMVGGALNQPTAPGYRFVGWYTAKDCTGEAIDESYLVGGENAEHFYAKWEKNQYCIQFDAGNGGLVTQKNTEPGSNAKQTLDAYVYYDTIIAGHISYASGQEGTNALPVAWKPGYRFSHWAVNGKKVDSQELNELTFHGMNLKDNTQPALVLTAVYTPVTITYHTNEGTFTEEWLKETGTEAVKDKNGSIEGWKSTVNDNTVGFGKPLAGYIDVTDKSAGTDYTLITNQQEGNTFAVLSTTADYYQKHNSYYEGDYRNDIGRKGWTFLGWQDKSGNSVNAVPKYPQEDIELWAQWSPNSYTLDLYEKGSKESKYSEFYVREGKTPGFPTEEKPLRVSVTVGEEIGMKGEELDGSFADSWPNRDVWYAVKKGSEENQRYLLGFTFDWLEPGAPGEEDSEEDKTYKLYASNVTALINHGSLLTKAEKVGEEGSPASQGSLFRLPESKDYESVTTGTNTVPDYPDGCTIPVYAVYRERSLVFIERYVDENNVEQKTVLYSEAYQTYSDYPAQYAADEEKMKAFEAMGYKLTGWSVNHITGGASYPESEVEYTEEQRKQWLKDAENIGSYDINVYTVFAAQVKQDITLTATQTLSDAHAEVREYTVPGSMVVKNMKYSITLLEGMKMPEFVSLATEEEKAEFEATRYSSGAVNKVAVYVELVNPEGEVQTEKSFWLNENGDDDLNIGVGANWKIRMTLYHSRVIPSGQENLGFVLNLGFVDDADQQIALNTTIEMKPTWWQVQYEAALPEKEHRVVSDRAGFSGNGDTLTYTVANWTYGSNLLAQAPVVEGYTCTGWKFSDQKSYGLGAPGTMTLTTPDPIQLTAIYERNSYTFTNNATDKCITDAATGTISYHDQVTLTPAEDINAAFIWLTFDGQSYRLDQLGADAPFYASQNGGTYTILMPAGDVTVDYVEEVALYLGYGSISIDENGYTQNSATVFWPGNYKILQWPETETFRSTENVLTVSGDLSERTISLGRLEITSDDSIVVGERAEANLRAEDTIEAKNILVKDQATLNLTGGAAKPTLTISPAKDKVGIGGADAESVTVKNVALALTMAPGTTASGVGGITVAVDGCAVTVTEEYDPAVGSARGTWFGGDATTSVTITDTSIDSDTEFSGTMVDGDNVTITKCRVGSAEAQVKRHKLCGNILEINESKLYMYADGTLLCPETSLTVDGEGDTASVIHIAGAAELLYENTLILGKAGTDIVISGVRLLDLRHGDIEITSSGSVQGQATLSHDKSNYRLLNRDPTDAAPAVTVSADGKIVTTETACSLGGLTVNGNVELKPLGLLQTKTVTIATGKTLTVTAAEDAGLNPEGFAGQGNYVQKNGMLKSDNDLVVGGDMTLENVTVTADGKNVGSNGTGAHATTVSIVGGSITAEKIGAVGTQSETFTFVELKGSPTITGNLVQDHFRLHYNLEDSSFIMQNRVPVDASDKKLATVLRSVTEYGAGKVTYYPEVPNAPKYIAETGTDYFGNWYLLDANDGKILLSESTVNGFDQYTTLSADLIQYAGVIAEDGTQTLELYAWMKINGTGIITYGRELNQVTGTADTARIESDGAWTARFDVQGAVMEGSEYVFAFAEALPVGTKLTLSLWEEGKQPVYYYYIPDTPVQEVEESSFKRMGTDAPADILLDTDTGKTFTHSIQLSADFADVSAANNTVTLQVSAGEASYEIDTVQYTVDQAAQATCQAGDWSVSYSVTPGEDKRLEGKDLYLVAEIRAQSGLGASYDAKLKLGDSVGTWIGGNMAYFPLGGYGTVSATTKSWSMENLEAGEYIITWYLTAAADTPNVFGEILAKSDAVTVTVAETEQPSLTVTLDSADGYVLAAGQPHTISFTYTATVETVSVRVEKQNALKVFNVLESVSVPGSQIEIPGEAGVYRIWFSMDGFENTSSDWDDVYFTFIVK